VLGGTWFGRRLLRARFLRLRVELSQRRARQRGDDVKRGAAALYTLKRRKTHRAYQALLLGFCCVLPACIFLPAARLPRGLYRADWHSYAHQRRCHGRRTAGAGRHAYLRATFRWLAICALLPAHAPLQRLYAGGVGVLNGRATTAAAGAL